MINPHGQGIAIFSLINDNLYAARTDELANEVAASVSFSRRAKITKGNG
ncbi:MAG: hypothetical protein AAFP77_27755 [Bacteroidota bacterium]